METEQRTLTEEVNEKVENVKQAVVIDQAKLSTYTMIEVEGWLAKNGTLNREDFEHLKRMVRRKLEKTVN